MKSNIPSDYEIHRRLISNEIRNSVSDLKIELYKKFSSLADYHNDRIRQLTRTINTIIEKMSSYALLESGIITDLDEIKKTTKEIKQIIDMIDE